MTVDDVFTIRGRGTVTTGRIEEGTLRVGDQVRINDREPVRVDGIEAFHKLLDQAQAGDNVGLLFSKLELGQVEQGDVITGVDDVGLSTPVAPPEAAAPAPPPQTATSPAPAAPSTPLASQRRDPRFAEAETQRDQFLSMREAGLMTDAQVDDALNALAFTTAGRQWKLTAGGDDWYSSLDGGDWKRETPPG